MLKLTTKSKLNPGEVVKKAVAYFGPGGYGLTVTNKTDTCASFEGGGGGVEITTCPEGKGTSVDFETREWENQVKEFARSLK
ncbi:MAG: hypothetical protein A2Z29_01725 [Chloroflexi bacterium RBG_16_56_11]|nr:MAG: hypothetical protein A2Z29_01725 [Chloroflexi bacterium RBG_16_56_11]